MIPIPLGNRHYKNRSLPASAQSLINFYPEVMSGDSKSKIILHSTPGLKPLVTLPSGPVHGLHVMNGVMYAVSGGNLYSINSAGVETLIGSVSGSQRVSMADNGTQLCIVNSSEGYTYSAADGLAQITDIDYLPASTVEQVDGYFLFPKDGTGDWFISGLLDGTAYDSLEYGTTYGNPDDVLTVLPDHADVFVFGKKSIEIKYHSGATDFPFSSKGKIERGCAAKYSTAKMDNTIYWLGDDLAVYKMAGYTPTQISDPALEYAIQQYSVVSDAFAYTYSEEGHKFYVLTFPTGNATWVYDASTGAWHKRAYRNPLSGEEGRHKGNCYCYCYGKHFVGDFENGKIYQLDLDTYTDAGDPLVTTSVFPPIHKGGEQFTISELFLEFESGIGLTSGQGSDPQVMLEESRDGGRTWGSQLFSSIGKKGDYSQQTRFYRRGSAQEYIARVSLSDPIKRTLISAFIR